MKILAVNWRDIKNPEAGGAEIHLHEISKRLGAKGYEVFLISSKYKGCRHLEILNGIRIIRIGNKYLFNFAFIWYYLAKLRKEDFDVIIDDVSKIPLCISYYAKKPVVAVVHHIHGKSLFRELPFPIALYIYIMERLLIPIFYRSLTIVSVSESTKEELIEMGLPSKNVCVINNGIENDLHPSMKSDIPIILYFGRVKKYKRLDHLIKAFKYIEEKMPNAKLIIAGKGDSYTALKSLASYLKLDSVEFLGEVSEEEKIEILQEAWIFVTTSEKEGWGISVLEANACGTPAIAYDVPGLRDSIKDGETGLLAKSGDLKALSEAMINVLRDDELREKLSKNAFEYSKQFSWDESVMQMLKILEDCTSRRRGI
jgi:glycosyltransferase involved in cell wall biosynthesis